MRLPEHVASTARLGMELATGFLFRVRGAFRPLCRTSSRAAGMQRGAYRACERVWGGSPYWMWRDSQTGLPSGQGTGCILGCLK